MKRFFLQQCLGPAQNYFIAEVKALSEAKARLRFEFTLGELPDNCRIYEIGGLDMPSFKEMKVGQVKIVEPLRGQENQKTKRR